MMSARLALVWLVAMVTGAGAQPTVTLLDTRFVDGAPAYLVRTGSAAVDGAGLRIAGDSRVDFEFDRARRIRSGAVRVWFVAPPMADAPTPLGAGGECTCALKVRVGRSEVELSDRWVRAQVYESRVTRIERVVASVNHSPDDDNPERLLELVFVRGALDISHDGIRVLRVDNLPTDLGDIHLATYRHSFTITRLVVEAQLADTLSIDRTNAAVLVAARYHPTRPATNGGSLNHHLVAWQEGRSAMDALFTTYASDSAIYAALRTIGARPGDNITPDAWNLRTDPAAAAPRVRATGTPLRIDVLVGGTTYSLDDLLKSSNASAMSFCFAGNRRNAARWNSGCVVCLASCPAGVIANSAISMHESHRNDLHWSVQDVAGIGSEDEVILRFSADVGARHPR